MKVLYIYPRPLTNTSAALNRINLFVRGIKENGNKAELILIPSFATFPKGIRQLLQVFLLLSLYMRFFLNPRNRIIIYGENLLWLLIALPRFAKILLERNEYPAFLIDQDYKGSSYFSLNTLKYFDGLITCSEILKKYYGNFLRKQNVFISPVIVDNKLFDKNYEVQKKISYCGDWGNNKDGVDILIESFFLFHKKFPEYTLELIGGSTPKVENELHTLVDKLGLNNSVLFTGRVEHHSMPEHLCNAGILALARPKNKQAEGGFPSKIAEYLATGRPVVVTNVGELHVYLKDNINCFMCIPDSADAFANRLCDVMKDMEKAKEVGLRGKDLAKQFGYITQSKDLYDFVTSL